MSVDPINSAKVLLTAIFAAVSTHFGAIGDLLWLFIAAAILDYVTGVAAAVYNKELDSGLGIRGILKKVGTFCIVAVAIISDQIVTAAGDQLGLAISTQGAIAAVVTIWLILNELISILENIAKLNVALPPFLMSAIKRLKRYTETSQEKNEHENDKQNPSDPDNPV